MIKIICPKCKRILGETDESMDAKLNCKGCKNTVDIKIRVAKAADYLPAKNNKRKEIK